MKLHCKVRTVNIVYHIPNIMYEFTFNKWIVDNLLVKYGGNLLQVVLSQSNRNSKNHIKKNCIKMRGFILGIFFQ